jgi:DNA polymerase III subunit delta'
MVTSAPSPAAAPAGVIGPDGAGLLPWLRPALDGVLEQARGHALLIDALPGVGQFELAVALAQSWLCEAEPATRGGARRLACGRCAACRLVAAQTHPDLAVVVPEIVQDALGWDAGADEAGEGAGEAASGKRKPSREIRVEQVRQAVSFAVVTSARGRGKVVVLHPADRMNAIASNTLLKTLEEPAGDTRFVLSCGAAGRLLPTIRSRCQPWSLGLPDPAAAARWLQAQGIAQPEVMLAAAGGQPLDAAAMAADGLGADDWLALPMAWRSGQVDRLVSWGLPRAIDAMLKLCHDLQRQLAGAPPRYFPSDRLPRATDLGGLNAWARDLLDAARHAEHPLHVPLAVESLAERGRRSLRAPVH